MSVLFPSKQILAPELLVPGKKPIGAVEIDKDHWINNKGIASLFQCKNNVLREDVSGGILSTTNTVRRGITPAGEVLDVIDNSAYAYMDGGYQPGTGDFTLFGSIYYTAETDAFNYAGGFSGQFAMIYKHGGIGGDWGFWDGGPINSAGIALVENTVNHLLITRSNGNLSCWRNGILDYTEVNSKDVATSTVVLGSYATSGSWGTPSILLFFVLERGLSDGEARSLTLNPYQILKPVGPEYFLFDTATGVSYPALLMINGQMKQYGVESPNYPLCINSDGSVQAYSDVSGKIPLVMDSGSIRALGAGETLLR